MRRSSLLISSAVGILFLVFGILSLVTSSRAQSMQVTQWEYVSVDYAQHRIISAIYSSDAEVTRYEMVLADAEPYRSMFIGFVTDGCNIEGDIVFDEEAQECIGRNFKGRAFFMNLLGVDGWELIQIDNNSTEYSYQLDMIFKRPMQ